METQLIEALTHRKDRQALTIIEEHPDIINENIIRLALDHGCIKVIRYLREHNKITAEGASERQSIRKKEYQDRVNKLDTYMPELEKFFDR